MMTEDQRRDRIGKRHGRDDFRPHLGMDADLLEFFLRQRAGFRQDVLRDSQLADVVEQRGGLDALNLRLRESHRLREAGRVDLHTPDVHLRRLIFCVDRARERLDRRQVQIRRLLHVPLLIVDAAHVHLVGSVREIQRCECERRDPVARVRDEPCRDSRGPRAEKVARCAPEEVRVPRCRDPLAG